MRKRHGEGFLIKIYIQQLTSSRIVLIQWGMYTQMLILMREKVWVKADDLDDFMNKRFNLMQSFH